MPRAVKFTQYGDVDVLDVVEVPRPVPAAGQVLVAMRAAGINPGEASIRKGLLEDVFPTTFPSGEGSDIAGVIEEVDEFVPQFYDVSKFDSDEAGTAIAAKIDPERCGPVFNHFGKRFRIGISTFGRARPVPKEDSSQPAYRQAVFFADLSQMDFASSSAFRLDVAQNDAGELVLSYRATRKTRIGDSDFDPGDAMQFILSTPGAVRAAVESARRIGGRLAGVVFFRWPGTNETLAMRPDEALAAAGPILNRWPAEFRL